MRAELHHAPGQKLEQRKAGETEILRRAGGAFCAWHGARGDGNELNSHITYLILMVEIRSRSRRKHTCRWMRFGEQDRD